MEAPWVHSTVVPARSFRDSADTTTRAKTLCQSTAATARPFVITPYVTGDDGRLVPCLPSYGPCGLGDEGVCRLVFDHYRPRTTGPCFALAVLRCTTHGRGFSLYPPGHVPYGRRAIAPVAPDGSPLIMEQAGAEQGRQQPDDEGQQAAFPPAALAFRGTVFDAALDAAAGCIWQRGHLPGGSERWWSSQGRWIDRALRLLALAPDQSVSLRHEIAELLVVDTLRLQELSSQLGGPVGYRHRGQAICQVLAALPLDSAFLAERLQNCGQRSGLWAAPLRWDRASGVLRREPFRLTDTRAPP